MLKQNGRMFHYIGDPESKTGARTTKGVVNRLKDAGFNRIVFKFNNNKLNNKSK